MGMVELRLLENASRRRRKRDDAELELTDSCGMNSNGNINKVNNRREGVQAKTQYRPDSDLQHLHPNEHFVPCAVGDDVICLYIAEEGD
jgi:hypothetical protein